MLIARFLAYKKITSHCYINEYYIYSDNNGLFFKSRAIEIMTLRMPLFKIRILCGLCVLCYATPTLFFIEPNFVKKLENCIIGFTPKKSLFQFRQHLPNSVW